MVKGSSKMAAIHHGVLPPGTSPVTIELALNSRRKDVSPDAISSIQVKHDSTVSLKLPLPHPNHPYHRYRSELFLMIGHPSPPHVEGGSERDRHISTLEHTPLVNKGEAPAAVSGEESKETTEDNRLRRGAARPQEEEREDVGNDEKGAALAAVSYSPRLDEDKCHINGSNVEEERHRYEIDAIREVISRHASQGATDGLSASKEEPRQGTNPRSDRGRHTSSLRRQGRVSSEVGEIQNPDTSKENYLCDEIDIQPIDETREFTEKSQMSDSPQTFNLRDNLTDLSKRSDICSSLPTDSDLNKNGTAPDELTKKSVDETRESFEEETDGQNIDRELADEECKGRLDDSTESLEGDINPLWVLESITASSGSYHSYTNEKLYDDHFLTEEKREPEKDFVTEPPCDNFVVKDKQESEKVVVAKPINKSFPMENKREPKKAVNTKPTNNNVLMENKRKPVKDIVTKPSHPSRVQRTVKRDVASNKPSIPSTPMVAIDKRLSQCSDDGDSLGFEPQNCDEDFSGYIEGEEYFRNLPTFHQLLTSAENGGLPGKNSRSSSLRDYLSLPIEKQIPELHEESEYAKDMMDAQTIKSTYWDYPFPLQSDQRASTGPSEDLTEGLSEDHSEVLESMRTRIRGRFRQLANSSSDSGCQDTDVNSSSFEEFELKHVSENQGSEDERAKSKKKRRAGVDSGLNDTDDSLNAEHSATRREILEGLRKLIDGVGDSAELTSDIRDGQPPSNGNISSTDRPESNDLGSSTSIHPNMISDENGMLKCGNKDNVPDENSKSSEINTIPTSSCTIQTVSTEEGDVDIDLNDPDVKEATRRMQLVFRKRRGHLGPRRFGRNNLNASEPSAKLIPQDDTNAEKCEQVNTHYNSISNKCETGERSEMNVASEVLVQKEDRCENFSMKPSSFHTNDYSSGCLGKKLVHETRVRETKERKSFEILQGEDKFEQQNFIHNPKHVNDASTSSQEFIHNTDYQPSSMSTNKDQETVSHSQREIMDPKTSERVADRYSSNSVLNLRAVVSYSFEKHISIPDERQECGNEADPRNNRHIETSEELCDLTDPDVKEASIKIQQVFRRKKLLNKRSKGLVEDKACKKVESYKCAGTPNCSSANLPTSPKTSSNGESQKDVPTTVLYLESDTLVNVIVDQDESEKHDVATVHSTEEMFARGNQCVKENKSELVNKTDIPDVLPSETPPAEQYRGIMVINDQPSNQEECVLPNLPTPRECTPPCRSDNYLDKEVDEHLGNPSSEEPSTNHVLKKSPSISDLKMGDYVDIDLLDAEVQEVTKRLQQLSPTEVLPSAFTTDTHLHPFTSSISPTMSSKSIEELTQCPVPISSTPVREMNSSPVKTASTASTTKTIASSGPSGDNDNDIDIDLNDPEVKHVAKKIQGIFKRKKMPSKSLVGKVQGITNPNMMSSTSSLAANKEEPTPSILKPGQTESPSTVAAQRHLEPLLSPTFDRDRVRVIHPGAKSARLPEVANTGRTSLPASSVSDASTAAADRLEVLLSFHAQEETVAEIDDDEGKQVCSASSQTSDLEFDGSGDGERREEQRVNAMQGAESERLPTAEYLEQPTYNSPHYASIEHGGHMLTSSSETSCRQLDGDIDNGADIEFSKTVATYGLLDIASDETEYESARSDFSERQEDDLDATLVIDDASMNMDGSSTHSHSPRFLIRPESTRCRSGDRARFVCCIAGYPIPCVKWFASGEVIEHENDERSRLRVTYYRQNEVQDANITCRFVVVSILEVVELRLADSGDYACVVVNQEGHASCTAHLLVEDDHAIDAVTERTWPECLTDEQRLDPRPNIASTNLAGPGSHLQDLDSTSPTSIPQHRVTALIGSKATFFCPVQGDPSPHVTWIKDGHPIQSRDRISVRVEGCVHCLEIDDVAASDAGSYVCLAENGQGTVLCTCLLHVQDVAGHVSGNEVVKQYTPMLVIDEPERLVHPTMIETRTDDVTSTSMADLPIQSDINYVQTSNGLRREIQYLNEVQPSIESFREVQLSVGTFRGTHKTETENTNVDVASRHAIDLDNLASFLADMGGKESDMSHTQSIAIPSLSKNDSATTDLDSSDVFVSANGRPTDCETEAIVNTTTVSHETASAFYNVEQERNKPDKGVKRRPARRNSKHRNSLTDSTLPQDAAGIAQDNDLDARKPLARNSRKKRASSRNRRSKDLERVQVDLEKAEQLTLKVDSCLDIINDLLTLTSYDENENQTEKNLRSKLDLLVQRFADSESEATSSLASTSSGRQRAGKLLKRVDLNQLTDSNGEGLDEVDVRVNVSRLQGETKSWGPSSLEDSLKVMAELVGNIKGSVLRDVDPEASDDCGNPNKNNSNNKWLMSMERMPSPRQPPVRTPLRELLKDSLFSEDLASRQRRRRHIPGSRSLDSDDAPIGPHVIRNSSTSSSNRAKRRHSVGSPYSSIKPMSHGPLRKHRPNSNRSRTRSYAPSSESSSSSCDECLASESRGTNSGRGARVRTLDTRPSSVSFEQIARAPSRESASLEVVRVPSIPTVSLNTSTGPLLDLDMHGVVSVELEDKCQQFPDGFDPLSPLYFPRTDSGSSDEERETQGDNRHQSKACRFKFPGEDKARDEGTKDILEE